MNLKNVFQIVLLITSLFITATQTSAWAGVADNNRVEKIYGIPQLDGYLILPDSFTTSKSYGDLSKTKDLSIGQIVARWQRFLTINSYLQIAPSTFEKASLFAKMALTKKEKIEILKKYNAPLDSDYYLKKEKNNFRRSFIHNADLDVFQKEEFVTSMYQYSKKFGEVVTEPLKVLNIKRLTLGEFNIKSSSFKIITISGGDGAEKTGRSSELEGFIQFESIPFSFLGNRNNKWSPKVVFTNRKWKNHITIPQREAKKIVKKADKRIYLAVFGNIPVHMTVAPFHVEKIEVSASFLLDNIIPNIGLEEITTDTENAYPWQK